VAADVGQRLLRRADQRELDRLGQPPRRALDAQPGRDSGGGRRIDQRAERVEQRPPHRGSAEQPDAAPDLAEPLVGQLLGPGQRGRGALRVGGQVAARGLELDVHDRQVVAEAVVDLARDAVALLGPRQSLAIAARLLLAPCDPREHEHERDARSEPDLGLQQRGPQRITPGERDQRDQRGTDGHRQAGARLQVQHRHGDHRQQQHRRMAAADQRRDRTEPSEHADHRVDPAALAPALGGVEHQRAGQRVEHRDRRQQRHAAPRQRARRDRRLGEPRDRHREERRHEARADEPGDRLARGRRGDSHLPSLANCGAGPP
jgi:hypothetical protein